MKKFHKQLKSRIQNHHLYKRTLENRYLALFLLIVIIFMTYSYFTEGFIYDITNQNLDDTVSFINSFGKLSWLGYIFAIIIEVVIAPIPSLILNVSASISFGSLTGAILTIIGASIGNTIAYFLAKRYGFNYFDKLINEKSKTMFHKYSDKYGPLFLFILRINPITSTDFFSYLAGLIGVPFKKFFMSTMLGIIPGIFIVSYFGEIFIKKIPVFKLLFLLITIIYIIIFIFLIARFSKNKVKERFLKK